MFRFEDPIYLYLLLLIPVLAVIRFLMVYQQKRRLRRFGDPELIRQLTPDVSRFRPLVKFWLLQAVLALIIVMIARPQFGTKVSHEKRTGIETIICMDISNSMLAEDVTPSRLSRAKMMVENLVDNFTNDKIGLIVFAGDAFVQLPITSDYVSAKMFLSTIDPSMIATQGTDIAAAISMASHSFTQQEGVGKAIIVITDGEDHEGGALEAAREAKDRDMRVYVLGVGSTEGAPIPMGNGDYLKDNTGQTVMTGLNEEMCRQVAEAGGGAYIHVENNSRAQELLDNELDKLSKKEIESTVYSDFDEQFQAVGILALLLLIIEVCVLEVKNPLLKRVSLFKKGKWNDAGSQRMVLLLFVSLMATLQPVSIQAQTDRQLVRQGNKVFRQGNYADAEVNYRKAVEKNPRNPQANYNLGNALLATRKDSAAVSQLEAAAKLETVPFRKAQAYHNIGVICQGKKMFGEAIEAYKEALRWNPSDDETRYNLALCKRQQQQQQNQQQQQKDNKQKKDKDQQQQQDQQQKKDQQQQQKQDQQRQQMSRENAEQMLNAAIQEEKQTQERMKKMQQPQRRQLEKNW